MSKGPQDQLAKTQLLNLLKKHSSNILQVLKTADLRELLLLITSIISTLKDQSNAAGLGTFESTREMLANVIASRVINPDNDDESIFQEVNKVILSSLINSLFDTLKSDLDETFRQHRRQLAFEKNHLYREQSVVSTRVAVTQSHLLANIFKDVGSGVNFNGDHRTGIGILSVDVRPTNHRLTGGLVTQECLSEASRLDTLIADMKGDHTAVLVIALLSLRNKYIELAESSPRISELNAQRNSANDMLRHLHAAISEKHTDLESANREATTPEESLKHLIKNLVGNELSDSHNLNQIKAYLCGHLEGVKPATLAESHCPQRQKTSSKENSLSSSINTSSVAGKIESNWNAKKESLKTKAKDKISESLDLLREQGEASKEIADALDDSVDGILNAAIAELSIYIYRIDDNAKSGDHARQNNATLAEVYIPKKDWGETLFNLFGSSIVSPIEDNFNDPLFVIQPTFLAMRNAEVNQNGHISSALQYIESIDARKNKLNTAPQTPLSMKSLQIEMCIKHLLLHFMSSPADAALLQKTSTVLNLAIEELEAFYSLNPNLNQLSVLARNLEDITGSMIPANSEKTLLNMTIDRQKKRQTCLLAMDTETKRKYTPEFVELARKFAQNRVKKNNISRADTLDDSFLQSLPSTPHPFYQLPTKLNKTPNIIAGSLLGLAVASTAGAVLAKLYLINSIPWVLPAVTWGLVAVAALSVVIATVLLVRNNFKHTSKARAKYTKINKHIAETAKETENETALLYTKSVNPFADDLTLVGVGLLNNKYALLAKGIAQQRSVFKTEYSNSSKTLASQMAQSLQPEGETKEKDFAKESLYMFVRILLANGYEEDEFFENTESDATPHSRAKKIVEEAQTYKPEKICQLINEVRHVYQETDLELKREAALQASASHQ